MYAAPNRTHRHALLLSGTLLLSVVLMSGCHSSPSNPEKGGNSTNRAARTERGDRPRRVMNLGASWKPSAEVIKQVGLTDDQVQRIAEIEGEFATRIGEAQRKEQRAALRYVRALSEEPMTAELVAEMQRQLDQASLDRLHIALDRVRAMRESLPLEQWLDLIKADPSAGRVGGFKPRFLGTVTIGSTETDTPTPPAE